LTGTDSPQTVLVEFPPSITPLQLCRGRSSVMRIDG
jgi:hypothetical protein